ncbi:MAG TPA: type IV pilus biogenesis protein PilP [Ramlibacter sp.]|jgi:type IV pilus biogenesis protein PilP|nr:type IV pilus biogenesis protein PilP [Ramlibacter sp.]
MQRAHSALLACSCALAAAGAQAQPPAGRPLGSPVQPAAESAPATPASIASPPVGAGTAAEIQRINEQMALLQAQLNRLELQARIAAKHKEIEQASTGGAAPAAASAFDSRAGLPSVVSVAGLKGRLEAVLVFPGGLTQRVRAGDVIDERRVARVALNEVVLTDLQGKKVQRLAFGSAPLTREPANAAPNAGAGPVPPLPSPVLGR